jgi:hypothetical protein
MSAQNTVKPALVTTSIKSNNYRHDITEIMLKVALNSHNPVITILYIHPNVTTKPNLLGTSVCVRNRQVFSL